MSGIIDKLVGRSGDARELLGAGAGSQVLDISEAAWGESCEMLSKLEFRNVRLAGKKMLSGFNRCRFDASEFSEFRSDGRFWGFLNEWNSCQFDRIRLRDEGSAMNTFRKCEFKDSSLARYHPYQTLFEGCRFTSLKVTLMRARLVLNSANRHPELLDEAATVVFRSCTFTRCSFSESYFAGIAFDGCTFVDSKAEHCDFEGVSGEHPWTSDEWNAPFVQLCARVLAMIHARCGPDSASARIMTNYIAEYRRGETRDQDFAGRLRGKEQGNEEWDRIADKVLKLLDEHFRG